MQRDQSEIRNARVKYIMLIVLFLFTGFHSQALPPEIPIPPMSAAKKTALGAQELIPASLVSKFVPGLRGHFNAATGIAFIDGRVHPSCVSMMSLAASPRITAEKAVPFALMASPDGVKCLERTHTDCAAETSCVSFQDLSRDPKTANHFKARVDTGEKAVENVKVTLSKKALVLNDKSVRLEATADCCNLASDPRLGDESPLPAKSVQQIAEVRDQLLQKVRVEDVAPAAPAAAPASAPAPAVAPVVPAAIPMPAPSRRAADTRLRRASKDDDDADDDENDKPKKQALAPGMQHVATDEEINKTVAENMLPFYKQYYEGLLQAQAFQYQTQMQMLQFQLSAAQRNQQTTTTPSGYGNLMNYNWSNLGAGLTSSTPNWLGYTPTATMPSTSTFTLPALGSGGR